MGRGSDLARRRICAPFSVLGSMDFPITAIRLETERLVLRSFRTSDFSDYFAMVTDPETFRFSERGPMSSEEAWTRLLRQAGHWALLGHGLFVVEEKESGRFAGEAGLGDFRRQLGPNFDDSPEAAWSFAAWAQRRGYATEAAEAALAWMERNFDIQRTVCLIHSANEASLRVAAKLGYSVFDQRIYRGYPALLHERRSPVSSASTAV